MQEGWELVEQEFHGHVWADEHPGGDYNLPVMDRKSTRSLLQLVAARTALWMSAHIPEEFQQLWVETIRIPPEWPGFRRVRISADEKEKR
jgi:hypothetical protein